MEKQLLFSVGILQKLLLLVQYTHIDGHPDIKTVLNPSADLQLAKNDRGHLSVF